MTFRYKVGSLAMQLSLRHDKMARSQTTMTKTIYDLKCLHMLSIALIFFVLFYFFPYTSFGYVPHFHWLQPLEGFLFLAYE